MTIKDGLLIKFNEKRKKTAPGWFYVPFSRVGSLEQIYINKKIKASDFPPRLDLAKAFNELELLNKKTTARLKDLQI